MRRLRVLSAAGWILCASAAGTDPAGATPDPPDPLATANGFYLDGRLHEALAAYREAAETGDDAVAATAHNNSCVILNNLADYPAALDACGEALRLRRRLGDERRMARTLNNLGLALEHLGRYDEAALTYGEALAINEGRGDVEAQLINRQNLGLVATAAGRYSHALVLFTGAQTLAEEHPGEPWAPRQVQLAQLHRGVVLERLGAYEQALDLYRSLAAEEGDLEPAHRASLQVNLGVVYRNLGDPVLAVLAFETAAEIYEQLGDVSALSNSTLNLALAWHLNLGRPDDAEAAYRKALELARASGDRSEEIQDLFYLGRLLQDRGRPEEAATVFESCLEASEAAGSSEGRWSALYGLGRSAAAQGQPRRALTHLEKAIDEIEEVRADLTDSTLRSGYFGDKRPVYATAVSVLAGLAAAEPAAGHREQALEIVQQIKSRELLESLGGGARTPSSPLSAGRLIELAGRDVVLEYFLAPEGLYLFVITGGGIRLLSLGPAEPILDRVLAAHQALAAGREPAPESLEPLSRRLLAGLEAELTAAPVLRIAPDGALHYLPFEILPVADPNLPGKTVLLIERVEVAYLPSASALGRLGGRRRPAELALAGFGSPVLGGDAGDSASLAGRLTSRFGLGPLPAAARELAAIDALLGGGNEIRSGGEATEDAVRRVTARGARVLHFATHTVVDERPGQGAGILLTPSGEDDGLLRPAEIAGLDLRADLTVLAACRSALGPVVDGRAFASLTGSFLAAGSSAVIASLWDVGDKASATFMEQLYYQLSRGHPPARALRRAKLRLRSDPAWNRPDLWAAFVLIGDAPGVMPSSRVPPWAWGAAALLLVLAAATWMRRSRRST